MAGDVPTPDQTPTPQANAPDSTPPAAQAAEEALAAATGAAEAIAAETGQAQAAVMPNLKSDPDAGEVDPVSDLDLLGDVDLKVQIELGRTRMYVEDVLRLNANSVIELDKAAGDPVDIYVNDRHVARGEVLVVNEAFCVRVSEIIHQPAPKA
ncbi:MAG: flagellar motor switch protein FliN [Planctomycetota bacterium]